jgi:hypothetical protein
MEPFMLNRDDLEDVHNAFEDLNLCEDALEDKKPDYSLSSETFVVGLVIGLITGFMVHR